MDSAHGLFVIVLFNNKDRVDLRRPRRGGGLSPFLLAGNSAGLIYLSKKSSFTPE